MKPIDYRERIVRLSKSLAQAKIDAYVATRMASIHYLVGAFAPWRGAVVVSSSGDARFIYRGTDSDRIRHEGWGMEVIEIGPEQNFVQALSSYLQKNGFAAGCIGLDLSIPESNIEAPGLLLANEYLELQKLLPKANLINGTSPINDLMVIKTPEEIERLRLASKAADAGFYAGLATIRPGITENIVAGAIENAQRIQGSTWAWSVTGGTEVGSGSRTAYLRGVTQQATENRIKENEFIILDIHPMVELYIVDFALPIFLGTPNSEQQKLIDCWHDAVETLWEGLKPGKQVGEICRNAVKVFAQHGFADFGPPIFGHGLGTCARTRPFLNPKSQEILQPGMVFALNTHIYKPGIGGARQEYPTVITESGCEPLSKLPPRVFRL